MYWNIKQITHPYIQFIKIQYFKFFLSFQKAKLINNNINIIPNEKEDNVMMTNGEITKS